MPEKNKIHFVTGRLAEHLLLRTLEQLAARIGVRLFGAGSSYFRGRIDESFVDRARGWTFRKIRTKSFCPVIATAT